jgi:hypothetical protein
MTRSTTHPNVTFLCQHVSHVEIDHLGRSIHLSSFFPYDLLSCCFLLSIPNVNWTHHTGTEVTETDIAILFRIGNVKIPCENRFGSTEINYSRN